MTQRSQTPDDAQTGAPVVEVQNVSKAFSPKRSILDRLRGRDPSAKAVCDVSLAVQHGETLGLVGESGCGKSTLAKLTTGQLTPDDGQVCLDGTRVGDLSERSTAQRRRVGVVFQHARGSFDPRWPVGRSIAEATGDATTASIHGTGPDDVAELLCSVDLTPEIADRYPRELSGGQIQRVALARAIAHDPDVIVLDEPVSGLDMATQARVLSLLADVQQQFGVGYLFISHDLDVVRFLADRVAVMYAGEIVEFGQANKLFQSPNHPYTEALIRAIPSDDPRDTPPMPLRGAPPDPADRPEGCPFHPRCPAVTQSCEEQHPSLEAVQNTRVRCPHAPEATGEADTDDNENVLDRDLDSNPGRS
ncbi:oligopeptide/dipeptide ABC transporter ATP-binding protein [Haloarcula argentinensis]|uniref:ABC transporter ATP-binding protein n=1 Tax=Haloarcula argentinensis TaxID=43776 RepID=A0ABU2F5C4_HALAR|nr:ABC transporter ATP-binding protein [Haloarcula argentinensis]MDS0255793.1 ABC transporter ATP-binding protein [Haloarcula argentinensis]